MRLKILILLLLSVLTATAGGRRKGNPMGMNAGQLYIAGRGMVVVPTNIGRESDEIGFKDVASIGFGLKAEAMYMTHKFIGVGLDLGFNTYPYKQQFWQSLNARGDFEATYRDVSMGILGRAFLSEQNIKPYIGASINGVYLLNNLDFQSYLNGTTADRSVSYKYHKFAPGFALEGGIFFETSDKTQISIAVRMNIIPRLDEDIQYEIDPYSHIEREIVVCPQGNENTIQFCLGLHFATQKKTRRIR